ncbi:hypothetical protein C8F01DRAFT_1266943 [Mycena amicta]|nr:hypothetical protein C8F01DRAFT_1266943 [Mycena amicta]
MSVQLCVLFRSETKENDHANVEKAVSGGVEDLKHEETVKDLAQEKLDGLEPEELNALMEQWELKKFDAVGGKEEYLALLPEDHTAHDLAMMSSLMQELGEEELAALPQED